MHQSEEETRCLLLELPGEVASIIMSFQAHSDRLSMAATCGYFWKAVEVFSERKLDEFRRRHAGRMDATWDERITDQSLIDTVIPIPVELPYRYLHWKAYRTRLCSFGRMAPCLGGRDFLHVLPDGEGVLTIAQDSSMHLWDPTTKESTVVLDGFNIDRVYEAELLVCGRLIVACFNRRIIQVCNLDGDRLHSYNTNDDGSIKSMAMNEQKVFFTDSEANISCLELSSGLVRQDLFTFNRSLTDSHGASNMAVCGNMLVFLCAGIYVFDLEDNAQKDFMAGSYSFIVKATDDDSTLIVGRYDTVTVLSLDEGGLTQSFSFTLSPRRCLAQILLVNRAHAYVSVYEEDQRKVEVYNILNGEMVHTIVCKHATGAASAKGSELFIGVVSRSHEPGFYDTAIQAYSLQM